MVNGERGIGNLAFIAVLVLLVIAAALAFVWRDEADQNKARADQANAKLAKADAAIVDARNAYDTLYGMLEADIAALRRTGQNYPDENTIKTEVRNWLWGIAEKVKAASEAKLRNRNYQINPDTGEVTVIKGDVTTLRLYGTAFAKDSITVQKMLTPLEEQFRFAADVVAKNNELYEQTYDSNKQRESELKSQVEQAKSKYEGDVSEKAQQAENFRNEANSMRDQANQLTEQIDAKETEASQIKAEAEKRIRTLTRDRNAWRDRARNEKVKKEIALKEDPKDGEVLVADARRGLVFINRGRKNQVSRGTRFTVWRPGKGNIRENIANIRVIDVERTRATCRIVEQLDPRTPVAEGMNISNPFYDPNKRLRVYIYGELTQYPTNLAKRRLAESGVIVADELDDRVNVIVLGEPPVTAGEEAMDEAEAALMERRMSMERDKNLRRVRDIAANIGAVVVTENVLRTFVEY